ncbi:uncharacterized protein LOC123397199 [Hordeum vulgare subsp. vulgare]|uniref:uncharacterized protein LOC123397199 n=1 Tax=Hordeum vulgare subsp. vulgare TaxID=112509 RepID=UPI001D1A5667|nr:uncharacterized protein LOC123397199 [Hordeum vulgare subsp. vulgare]
MPLPTHTPPASPLCATAALCRATPQPHAARTDDGLQQRPYKPDSCLPCIRYRHRVHSRPRCQRALDLHAEAPPITLPGARSSVPTATRSHLQATQGRPQPSRSCRRALPWAPSLFPLPPRSPSLWWLPTSPHPRTDHPDEPSVPIGRLVAAGRLIFTVSSSSPSSSPDRFPVGFLTPPRPDPLHADPETNAAAGYDYPPDDQPFVAEQQDDGAQKMAYPADDDCYPDGAYYYVKDADDLE